jgi:nucleoside-diphosphate-sugar epimerase
MSSALIGHSGFVGGTLLRQSPFDELYRSTNIGEIRGREYDLLVCAGAPAAKWKANQDPEGDLRNLRSLMDALGSVSAKTAVLISTVDVYARPVDVYEETAIQEDALHAYGRHRYALEKFFTGHFPRRFVLRLPGLFGWGLRKNFLFDLLRNPDSLHMTHRDSVFQFYDMSRLWMDVQNVVRSGVPLINMATPPVAARRVAKQCFGVDFDNVTAAPPVQYDMRTRHARIFGSEGDYIVSEAAVLDSIAEFARQEQSSE